MSKLFFSACSLILLFCHKPSSGQGRLQHNQLEIDKAKAALKTDCKAFESSMQTTENKIRADKKLIAFLNEFYNMDVSADEITKKLNQLYKGKWKLTTTDLGGLKKYEIQISLAGNLKSSIGFSVFQNEIVFKKIFLATETHMSCISPRYELPNTQDVNYLDIFCLPLIDFPMVFCAKCEAAQSDTTFSAKLKSYTARDYKLFSVDSLRINEMTWYADDTYYTDDVEKEILVLAENHNTNMLFTLLYSPNQIVAINSMEAVVFLQASGIINLQADIQQKIEQIQTSDTKINWQSSNAERSSSTYKELNISKEKILDKFTKALHK
ncbi:MAG: hypothetical protein ABJC98_19255 [Bacteroidota bacterium]